MRKHWRQQARESCGAAVLMVALAELSDKPLSLERELDLWQAIRAAGNYLASLPGRIGLRAAQEGTSATIWTDEEMSQRAAEQLAKLALFDVPSLLEQHRAALADAKAAGIPIRVEETDSLAFLGQLVHGDRLILASAVAAEGGIVLHWRLYRIENGVIWEMDPASGTDTPLTENQFLDRLSTYVGAGVSLSLGLEAASSRA